MRIVFDTNIYLAAMSKPEGFCRGLLYKIVKQYSAHELFISPEILEELVEKSRLLIKEGLVSKGDFQTIIKLIYRKAWRTSPLERLQIIKTDPDDNKILECAVAAKADLIVSMDRHLYELKRFRNIGIVRPKDLYFMLPK